MRLRSAPIVRHPATLGLLWAASVALVAAFVDHFWIPLDDGTLAQSAERVLSGDLPHRDFGDPYTGLNAVVGALSFALFGTSLASLRIPLVVAYALWLPAVWIVAYRFAGPAASAAATLLVAGTSVLAYPAAMPTWFGLFAVTWGLAFLLHALEGGGRGWLVAAGAMAGVSILFKVTGLYFVAAALLALAWRQRGGTAYAALCGAGLLLFLALLGGMVLPGGGVATVVLFFLPGLAVCAALAGRIRPTAAPSGPALAALAKDVAALVAGVALPVGAFLVPYALTGSVGAWFEGVFLLPSRRFGSAASPPGAAWTVLPGLVAVGLVWLGSGLGPGGRRWVAWSLGALLTVGLAIDDAVDGGFLAVLWYAMRGWIPVLTVWGAWVALRRDDVGAFAAVAAAGLWVLVQFPYTAPAYLFYVAPLGVLATLAVVRPGHDEEDAMRPTLFVVAAVWAFLGLGYSAGVVGAGDAPLAGDRGGIRVAAADSAVYGALVAAVDARMHGGALWVTPDAPEVYYLTGQPNPTGILYEFLGGPDADPPDLADTDVVVVNTRPLFSAPVDAALRRRLGSDGFAVEATVGPFEVYARPASPPSP